MGQEKVRVIVEVRGGVVQNIVCGDFVEVSVLDWDNLEDEPHDEFYALPIWVQSFIKKTYPKDYAELDVERGAA